MVEKNVLGDIIYLKTQIGVVLNKKMNLFERLINHPGRKLNLQCIDYICIAATPPSKGGETSFNKSCNKTIHSLKALLWLLTVELKTRYQEPETWNLEPAPGNFLIESPQQTQNHRLINLESSLVLR